MCQMRHLALFSPIEYAPVDSLHPIDATHQFSDHVYPCHVRVCHLLLAMMNQLSTRMRELNIVVSEKTLVTDDEKSVLEWTITSQYDYLEDKNMSRGEVS